MIGLDAAAQLLDFRGLTHSISRDAARGQLEGAVALHNILQDKRVAYLADEVGMGKTYVALGAIALFRHFDPRFRLLVIAPRENIQKKWMKELRNFVRNNVRFPDLRVKAVHGAPARSLVSCRNLIELVRESYLNPDRDFFARLTSFSLPLGADADWLRRRRDELIRYLPWADRDSFRIGRSDEDRAAFKDAFAKAVCTSLPNFDLVVVDEGHNLKHGFGANVSARNRLLALAFGRAEEGTRPFPGYGPRAKRVLFLSATPLENDYSQLWNQLDVFGLGGAAPKLVAPGCSDEEKRACVQNFLIRRVSELQVAGGRLTRNLYRREWRHGGVRAHDEPFEVSEDEGDRQRLVVALVQKKVSEVLGHEKFNNSFQIGMLASFESFLQTAGVRKVAGPESEHDDISVFDDAQQTDDVNERLGADVGSVNALARSYFRTFKRALPHPKMDALVQELAAGLPSGRKALVFVRRVASVTELQVKLAEQYDAWLIARLKAELPFLAREFDRAFSLYQKERAQHRRRLEPAPSSGGEIEEEGRPVMVVEADADDRGGLDSFFAWFFRGEGPSGYLSGARLQRRFAQATSAYSTLFEDNYVAWVLGAPSGKVLTALADYLRQDVAAVRSELTRRGAQRLPSGRKAGKIGRLHLFQALQEAGLELLAQRPGPARSRAASVLEVLQVSAGQRDQGAKPPAEFVGWLEQPTVFTELRRRPALRGRLWPEPDASLDFRSAFREQELRRHLLSGMARLGHAFIDLYLLVVGRTGSIRAGAREDDDDAGQGLEKAYLDLLEKQMAREGGEFRAFHELAEAGAHFDLILNVNTPDLRTRPLVDAPRMLGTVLGRQQPIGGMFGGINMTLVRQFRMPGYPIVLVTTDLLQEGEDLHTFCSAVYHYGISWMPSSMEQRVGRLDRVNSQTERRLTGLARQPTGDEKLQVYYPHLRETVEVLQVNRVLERLNQFMRIMHKDLGQPKAAEKKVALGQAMHRTVYDIAPITEPLTSAFPVRRELLQAPPSPLAVTPEETSGFLDRFRLLKRGFADLVIRWADSAPDDALIGTVVRHGRQQPFTLLLRCVSPIGRVGDLAEAADFAQAALAMPAQITATRDDRLRMWLFAAEGEVLLRRPADDSARAAWLVRSVTRAADSLEQVLLPGSDPTLEDLKDDLLSESENAD